MDVCVFVKVDVIITGQGGGGGWLITRRIRIISKLYRKRSKNDFGLYSHIAV